MEKENQHVSLHFVLASNTELKLSISDFINGIIITMFIITIITS